ncbi:MAG: FAD/NAD(P)-binding oxidoreductase [Ilumatobacteraceae bacterium]
MNKRIVILGGGTGGTLTANRLRKHFKHDDGVSITVVDQDGTHVYQPGLLFLPFGLTHAEDIMRPRKRQLHQGIEYVATDRPGRSGEDVVLLEDGSELAYDVLVVATGARLAPEETEGLTGPGWNERMFTFYDVPGAEGLQEALEHFTGGRLVVNAVDMPIKCPVAPPRVLLPRGLVLTQRGIRDQVEIVFATPLDGAFTKPVAPAALADLLDEKGIHLVTEFNTGEVDGAAEGGGGMLVGYDGREVPFDLLAVIPLHSGADYVARSEGRRRAQLRPDRRLDAAVEGQGERLRPRRRHEHPDLQGRIGHPLRG